MAQDADWQAVLDGAALGPGDAKTVKVEGVAILVRRDADGTLAAIDNRCPHEGYPLSQGSVKDGVLTCVWHNWKFRLRDGACVLGGEDVRRYPVREADGQIELDVAPPPPAEAQAKIERSLTKAFREDDWGHAARDVERLLALGRTPDDIVAFGAHFAAVHSRYGFDHGHAAAPDYLALAARYPEEASYAVVEALHGLANPHVRRSPREFAAAEPVAVTPGPGGWAPLGLDLRRRIEAEDRTGAQALFRGAVEDGVPADVVFGWLAAAASDHFLDFGHAAIYVVKADELLERIGWSAAHPVLTSLVSRIVGGTREDLLPYMRAYRTRWPRFADRLDGWASRGWTSRTARADVEIDVDAFEAAVLTGSLEAALDAVADALDAGLAPDRIALLLAHTAARRLLAFDPAIQADPSLSEGWLHVTHTLTHADAVRETILRWPSADALRGLFQSARFIHHIAPLMIEEVAGTPRPGDLAEALTRRAPQDALDVAAGAFTDDPDAAADVLRRGCLSTPMTRPIFAQHHIKTVLAADRIASALYADPLLGAEGRWRTPWLGTVRFLAHPMPERRLRSAVSWARDFVHEGKMRRNLLGY